MSNKEKFYDTEIAPELLRLAKLCQDKGLSFVAGVEWAPGDLGRTAALTAEAGEGMRKANLDLQVDRVQMVAFTVTKP